MPRFGANMRLYAVAPSDPGSVVKKNTPLGRGFALCSSASNGWLLTAALSTARRVVSGTNRNGTPHEMTCTGVASGPLGCYLVHHKIVKAEAADRMLSLQGVKMGRPSHVHISIGMHRDEIASVRVGGQAVLAGEGILYV